jgi:hypothetical protein
MQAKFDASQNPTSRARGRRAWNQVQTTRRAPRLLDRDREPGDQLRHFVESFGIMILDRSCKAGKAFVVTHRWYIAWDDRRYRTLGLNDRHNITSRIQPAKQASYPNKTFWRPAHDTDACSCRWIACAKCRRRESKALWHLGFSTSIDPAPGRPISAMQAPEALLYAARRETLVRPVPR